MRLVLLLLLLKVCSACLFFYAEGIIVTPASLTKAFRIKETIHPACIYQIQLVKCTISVQVEQHVAHGYADWELQARV